jgi:multimeric flavodoxin WrbA
MAPHALFLNCTLKRSPTVSNTQALIDKCASFMEELGATTESIRVVDYEIPHGIDIDMGGGDQWPEVYERIKACDILVPATPIWFGVRGSVLQKVVERLDGSYAEGDRMTGQYPLYGKVAGCIVTGNEDGAHDVCSNTLFNMTHLGCTVPPNVDCYWVGDAGPGPSYIEAHGDRHRYTNRTALYMAHNLVWMAGVLASSPCPTNLRELDSRGIAMSDD